MLSCQRGEVYLRSWWEKAYELGVDSKVYLLYKKFTNYKE